MATEKLVLIIEDEQALAKALQSKLEQLGGVRVVVAHDGHSGLRLALSSQPDLILLDLLLPKIDGVKLLSRLREDSWGKTARVVIVTNLNSADKEKEVRKLEVEDFIVKTDITLSDLGERLKKALG